MKLLLLTTAFFGVAFTYSPNAPAIVGEESPMAPEAEDVTQTKTDSNTVAISGDFTQYIPQRNGITNLSIDPANGSPATFTFRDVRQTSTLSNSGAIGGDLTQYIIHINGVKDNSRAINIAEKLVVNGSHAPVSLIGPDSVGDDAPVSDGPVKSLNVFRDVTQTSTLSNSGAVTGDLVQYIIHINGMTIYQLGDIADSAANNDDKEDAVEAGSKYAIIKQLMKKIVDTMSVNGIESPEKP